MRMFDVTLKEGLHRHTIDQRLFDVTLATDDGKEIKAHKLILLAGSQLFMKLFVKNNPTRIQWQDYRYFQRFINFKYGQCEDNYKIKASLN